MGCRLLSCHTYFNSLPHAEVDWLRPWKCRNTQNFNSLPHAEVDRRVHSESRRQFYFNSLPHAEVDQG